MKGIMAELLKDNLYQIKVVRKHVNLMWNYYLGSSMAY